jgi:phosphatidylglycerophosphatase C
VKTSVAFFDFDGTLTRRDSLLPFLRMVAGTPLFVGRMAMLSPVLAAYSINVVKNNVAKEIVLSAFLAGKGKEELQQSGATFAVDRLPAILRPAGMERLHWHQGLGHVCVLVSASLDVYLAPWARSAGFNDWITSSLEIDAVGRVKGRLKDGNCFGEKKAQRIRAWLMDKGFDYSFAYGDSMGDLPMLALVDEGYMFSGGTFSLVQKQMCKE